MSADDLAIGTLQARLAEAFPDMYFTSEKTGKYFLINGYVGGDSISHLGGLPVDPDKEFEGLRSLFAGFMAVPE